jgi:NAD(P)-dependent dehydrogenase (short-subunit alcohol dehydrogenase family)
MGLGSSRNAVKEDERCKKVVVITGCDSGIGLAVAKHAAIEQGFKVVASCLTTTGQEVLQEVIGAKGGVAVQGDLTTEAGMQTLLSAAEKAAESVGGGIWALVNNAGIVLPGNVEWNPPEAYEKTMAINYQVPVKLVYELLPLIKKEKGRVINVTSVDGFIALPSNAAYNSSKHALEAYSDTLRIEMLPWGVKVSVIEPATMRTPLAMRFFDAWHQSFKNAPEERKAQYGESWAEEIAKTGTKGLEDIAADPKVTVVAIADALVSKKPKIRYATGKMATYFFKPISRLPHSILDKMLYGMTFPGKPRALRDQ